MHKKITMKNSPFTICFLVLTNKPANVTLNQVKSHRIKSTFNNQTINLKDRRWSIS